MTGPTTTGSIDAKLTVDDSDFKRGMAEAKAEAKEVGSLEPSVKVDANVGPALAKLEAVAKAERDLADATNVQAKADKDRAASYAQLAELRKRYDAAVTPADGSRAGADRNAAMPMVQKLKAELDQAEADYRRLQDASNQAHASVFKAETAMTAARAEGMATIKAEAEAAEAASRDTVASINRVKTAADALGTSTPTVRAEADTTRADAKLQETKAKVDEVAAASPTVKVDANVASALAKLDAVALAERNLDIAYQRSAIAQEKLDAVTKKHGEDSLQAASARLALTRAMNSEHDAEIKLNDARNQETESTKAGVKANRDRISGMQVLMALAPEILAASAPIVGAATGLAVGFGVMGLSGVLAFKGIKDAMQVGDRVGNEYSAGLQGIKEDLNNLAGTSANAMLSAFNQMVGDINSRMPFLNTLIGNGSVALGQMGGTAMRGVLDGLQTMNPLIQAGSVELGKFVTWLFSFNGTVGFKDFIGYAMDSLPPVMHLLESLVTTAGHILAAFAPLGPPMIAILSGISDWVSSFPLPVLAGVVTMATQIGPALKTAFAPGVSTLIISVAEAIGFTGVMANLAVPVVGVLTALVAGIGVAAATSAMGTQAGTDAFVDYGNAIERDNGLIGDNVRLQAAHAATTKEMRDAADSLGISTMVVIQAMLGDKDAQQQVNDKMSTAIDRRQELRRGDENLTDTSLRLKAAKDTLTEGIDKNSTAITNNKAAYDAYHDAIDATTNKTSEQSQALQLQANQFGTSVAAIKSAQDAEDKTGQSTADTTTKMQMQSDAAGLLKASLDGLNGKAMSAAQAQNAFDSSLANMGTHVDATGKQIQFTTSNIGDMSAASVALRGQLNGQVSNLMQVVEANGGLSNSTGEAKKQMEDMRKQIINNAVAHGVDKDAVTAYVDNLLTIPPSVPPTKVDIDKAEAEKKLQGFQSAINSLTGKTVDIYSVTHIQEVRDGPAVNGISGNAIANSMDAANQYAQDNAYNHADGGEILYRAGGGGVPFRPSGTDTVPAMLTPGEVVMNRMSVASLGLGNLLQANRTGQWPEQGGGGMNVAVYIGGEAVDSRMVQIVQQELNGVARQIGGMRR